jgi:gamma-glutamyltranspeptidase/glutathione hydrolase
MFGKADLEPHGLGSGAYQHILAETFRGAIVDRMRAIGDPAFVNTDVSALTGKGRLLDRRAQIALDRTRPATKFYLQEHGTTHLVVVDGEMPISLDDHQRRVQARWSAPRPPASSPNGSTTSPPTR